MTKPVCLVVGAGAGIGGTVGSRFAQEGYHTVFCRRSNKQGLQQLVEGVHEAGGEASGFLLDVIEERAIEDRISDIEKNIGPIEIVVFNIGAQTGFHSLEETSDKVFERSWRIATLGLFRMASMLCPIMAQRGHGTILVTSSTAAVRGNSNQHAHSAAMGGRRMLCQSLNAEFAPQGIHLVHILIDSIVDAPDTVGKILGEERFQALRQSKGLENEGLVLPEKVAETYVHLANQHRSTWTFELDLRPFSDTPWWNHS